MKYIFYIILITSLFSQSIYNHPELIWKTFETKNFIFHYHQGTENTVNEAAYVAENIYEPITNYYQYRPDEKTVIIIKDTDDFSNGTAYYYDNKIEIWALPLDFDLRGSHRWLQNVITHEFTHIIQIGKSMKASKRVPAIYLQGFTYEKEKRDDVLYGFPNSMYSLPIPGVAVPPWLAEGTAQIMSPVTSFDYWDSHRDMLLRDKVLNNNLLSLNQMNSFGKKGIGSEAVYNQGFSFSKFLVDKYGTNVLPEISDVLSKNTYSVNKAIFKVTGKYGEELFQEWKITLENEYNIKLKNVQKTEKKGHFIINDGTTNIYPKWSPNGNYIAYLSNKDNDYFGQTDLFVYNVSDSTSKKIISGARYAPSWLNDTTLLFTMRTKPNEFGSKFFDIYKISLNQKEPEQLTYGKRLRSPSFNASNNQISAISTIDGISNIYVSNADSIDFKKITNFKNQEYIGLVNWGNQDTLLFDVINNHGRDLYIHNMNKNLTTKIYDDEYDIRNPFFYNDRIYFSKNFNGIFNIAYYENKNEIKFITNCFGGAFMPDIYDGKMVYSVYENGGYKISLIDTIDNISKSNVGYTNYQFPEISNLNYENVDDKASKSIGYSNSMTKLHFVPRLMLDYNTTKYGMYLFSDDMIGKLSFFGGISINKIKDIDAFLMFDYKKFKPTIYFNFFWATRHTNQKFEYFNINDELIDNININNRVNYQIFSSDLGFRMPFYDKKIEFAYEYNNYKQNIFQLATQDFISDGEEQIITTYGKLGFDYFQGHNLSLKISEKKVKPEYLGNMLPSNGYIYNLSIAKEFNYFMDGFSLNEEYGTFGSIMKPNHTSRLDFDFQYSMKNKHVSTSVLSKIGVISNKNIDDFFYYFGGGLPGIKGYTFYEPDLTGYGFMVNTINFRKLLMDKSFFDYVDYLDLNKLSLGLIYQFGNAYNGSMYQFTRGTKVSTGIEIRAKGFIFYGYPLAMSIEHHFALNDKSETKGKSYFKLLFDF